MRIDPYLCADGTPFTATRADILAAWGTPLREGRNVVELDEMDYGEVVFRFQDSGRLEEITRRAPVVHFGAVAVPFGSLRGFLAEQDGEMFERAGFVVSPRYGLAFVPWNPDWVTALAQHCIGTWRAM